MPADDDATAEEEDIKLVGEARKLCTMPMTWTMILLVFWSILACLMNISGGYLSKLPIVSIAGLHLGNDSRGQNKVL